jgi:thiosulfate/3-mercaptopyruvate sulfurtransferase
MAAKTPRPTKAAATASAPAKAALAKAAAKTRAKTAASGPLISAAWLAEHLDDPDLRIVHVSPDKRVYNKRHIVGATYSDLHRELALKGTAPETGDAPREWLVPDREATERVLRAWRVGDGDRIVFYDDVGMNRQAIRGYWLMRLYGFPQDRLHILDGGIEAWRRTGGATTTEPPEADLADALRKPVTLDERDETLIATYEQVLAWSKESAKPDGPTRLLDVRTASEWVGTDLRAKRGGHIPGARQRCFVDLLTDEGTFRPVAEMVSLVRASGADPDELRATYCQGGVRAALVWFVLHELAGFDEVRSYAGSWEEWGNRSDSPITTP